MTNVYKKSSSLVLVTLLAVSPLNLYAQDFQYTTMVLGTLLLLVGRIVPLLLGLALIVFVWGLIVFIAKADNEQERESGKQKMIWGVIGLFVVVSMWGIVLLVQEITGMDSDKHGLGAPGIPQQPAPFVL